MRLFNREKIYEYSPDNLSTQIKEDYDAINTMETRTSDIPPDISLSPISQFLNFYPSYRKYAITRNMAFGNVGVFKPHLIPYTKLYETQSDVRLISYINRPSVILGKYVGKEKFVNIIDFQNKKINGSYQPVLIYDSLLVFEDYTYNRANFIYFDDTILISKFKPNYEKILYPMSDNVQFHAIWYAFEVENKEEYDIAIVYDIVNDSAGYLSEPKLTIKRPKLLFSPNLIDWKKYDFDDNSWVDVSPDNGEYFTPDELRQKGMTISDYLKIPQTAFENYEDLYVMMNNYIPAFKLLNSYLNDKLGTTSFIANQSSSLGSNILILNI